MSVGDAFVEVNLNSHPMTMIVGKNGHGKTVFGEALCYGLFGRSWRGIKKPTLINSVNGKNLLVEIEFNVQGRDYMIRRGMKPSILEIYCDGELLNQSASIKDYQAFIEANVLHLNFKSFVQVVMLGTRGFVPFMELPAAARREIIEDLLDLRVFTAMNTILKERMAANRESIAVLQLELGTLKEVTAMKREHLLKILEHGTRQQEIIEERRSEIHARIADLEQKTNKLATALTKAKDRVASFDPVFARINEIDVLKRQHLHDVKTLEKENAFFQKNKTCSTCSQAISEEFRHARLATIAKTIGSLRSEVDALGAEAGELQLKASRVQEIQSKVTDMRAQLYGLEVDLANQHKALSSLDSFATVDLDAEGVAAQIEDATNAARVKSAALAKLSEEKETFEAVAGLLKDSGIKAQILSRYLPLINATVNKYLAEMQFLALFEIDSNFNERLRSRFYDDFSYENFSQGEKMRIDLALLLSWRQVAAIKNSVNTNLLVFDEILDASLDTEGCDILLDILKQLSSTTSIFVISHKGDVISDKFDRVLEARKTKGFSSLTEIA